MGALAGKLRSSWLTAQRPAQGEVLMSLTVFMAKLLPEVWAWTGLADERGHHTEAACFHVELASGADPS